MPPVRLTVRVAVPAPSATVALVSGELQDARGVVVRDRHHLSLLGPQSGPDADGVAELHHERLLGLVLGVVGDGHVHHAGGDAGREEEVGRDRWR